MNDAGGKLTELQIMAAASSTLVENGYRQSPAPLGEEWTAQFARVFEDPYSVVAVAVFPTWAELKDQWTAAQASLISAMSQSISSADPKVWEGYLVLLTPSTAGTDRAILDSIRRDTSRTRKLVATGEELRRVVDIEEILGPLLPLEANAQDLMIPEDPLESLASLPAVRGIPLAAIERVVDAFRNQQPILERLNRAGGNG